MISDRIILISALSILLFCTATAAIGAAEPPDMVVLDQLSAIFKEVIFDHEMHNGYAACVECHHHLTGSPPSNPACTPCHRQGTVSKTVGCWSCHRETQVSEQTQQKSQNVQHYHIDVPGLKGAYHLRCVRCHLSITAGPTGCQDCHILKMERRSS